MLVREQAQGGWWFIGLGVANFFTPGSGFNADPSTLDASSVARYASAAGQMSTKEFLLHIIPKTFVSAFSEGEILQVLFLSILFGLALGRLGPVVARAGMEASRALGYNGSGAAPL